MSEVVDVERLVGVLGLEVELVGDEWRGQCPSGAHPDRHPSWSIVDNPGSEKHGIHRCWSCKWSGNVFTLVAFLREVPVRSVDEWLEREGLFIGGSRVPMGVELESKVDFTPGFRMPAGVDFGPLEDWVTPARRYAKQRGITEEQVERWGLGYSVMGALEGRLVIPVRSETGRLESYMARSFTGDALRYLTPREGSGASKRAVFGAERWCGRRGTLYLAEGALNALALERAGAELVAALGGSSLTAEAAGLLAEHERLVLFLDSDRAGAGAASQVRGALGRWQELREVWLPQGRDAADMPVAALRRWLATA